MSAMLAGVFAVPAGIYLAGRTRIALAFIMAMIVFMPLFVFLPKLIQRGMQVDAQAVVEAFGKNEHVMRVIWALSVAIIELVITKVLDPGVAQQVVGGLTTRGCESLENGNSSLLTRPFDATLWGLGSPMVSGLWRNCYRH